MRGDCCGFWNRLAGCATRWRRSRPIFWATARFQKISSKYAVYSKTSGKGEPSLDVKIYFGFAHPSSLPVTSRENTRICCGAEVDKRPTRNAYARESATSESGGMNRFRDKTVSRARFLSRGQDFPGFSSESRQPFILDHYLMNSQHTTIAVFAGRSLIIRSKDIVEFKFWRPTQLERSSSR